MHLNKRYFSLLLVATILSCSPNEKTSQQNKKITDTVHTNRIIIKNRKDTLLENKEVPFIDYKVVLVAFNKAIKTAKFSKELNFNYQDKLDVTIFDWENPILIGDLNDDHLDDAIVPFTIEERQGGWNACYAIFINNGGILEYKYSFNRGGGLAERRIDFKSIKDGIIKGIGEPGFYSEEGNSTPVNYMYRPTDLSEVATASEAK
ncbi:hypothetical protein [Chryseobacterium herbae]|uniref:Lipoprotein n=1 Tax=Chryseobacterium herbae TaxID=2976476 RepID=A0ABT2ITF3_9FLAO|nr:hypothetical protein [Chryseobacterium sp. pc1-10]MCT2562118.1 hypothetical protein [Chryseobacterium sp. pc1-10]